MNGGVNVEMAFNFAQLAITLLSGVIKKNPTQIEETILDIVRKGHSAYEAQTGKPIDPSLLNPIEPIP